MGEVAGSGVFGGNAGSRGAGFGEGDSLLPEGWEDVSTDSETSRSEREVGGAEGQDSVAVGSQGEHRAHSAPMSLQDMQRMGGHRATFNLPRAVSADMESSGEDVSQRSLEGVDLEAYQQWLASIQYVRVEGGDSFSSGDEAAPSPVVAVPLRALGDVGSGDSSGDDHLRPLLQEQAAQRRSGAL